MQHYFILRDNWLVNKVIITGTVVYIRVYKDKIIIGIDDSTGVINGIFWINDKKEELMSDKEYFDSLNLLDMKYNSYGWNALT